MTINSLNEAMEILQRDTLDPDRLSSISEEVTVDSILSHSREHLLDSEFAAYISSVIDDIGYTKAEVLEKAGISEIVGFQIFAGIARPTFNQLTRICLGAGFTLAETQRAIDLAGYTPLNPNNPRDEALIYAINYMKSIKDTTNRLYELNLPVL